MPSPASPGGSKVTYAVKRTEQEMAWEQGYYYDTTCSPTLGSQANQILFHHSSNSMTQ